MRIVDVAIIGAGPAGSAATIALADCGYEVALIDKQAFPREKLCGDFINPINWGVFRDLGVEDRVLAAPHGEVTGFRMTDCSGREAEARFGSRDRQRSMGLGLRRAALDQMLAQRAAELGATTCLGSRVEKLSRTAQGWQLKIGEEWWQAKVLIGADGRNSWVAHQLGLHRSAAVQGRSVGFQSRLRCVRATAGQIEIHLFPGGYAGVVSLGDGAITLGMAIDKRKLGSERGAEFLFHEVLAQNPHLREIIARSSDTDELRSAYPVYFPARRCVIDGALLVGDAARVSEPVTGEGIYFAMRSGLLAAETIDFALRRGNLAAEVLAGYELNCRRAFRSRLALNAILRFAVYRPALLDPFIRLSAKNGRLLHSLVEAVCVA
jgi:geranylgeranyl reductase family protein